MSEPDETPEQRAGRSPDQPLDQPPDQPPEHPLEQEHGQLHEQIHRLEHRLAPLIEAADHLRQAAVQELAHEGARLTPAWRRVTAGELRWPVSVVVAAMITMQLAVPARLSLTGQWPVPAVEAVLLAVLVLSNPARVTGSSRWMRGISLTLIATASLANAFSAVRLISELITGQPAYDPKDLLAVGGNIWLTNVIVFGLWYWELDRGGPASRAMALKTKPSFLFPEMTAPELADPGWHPQFIDYLYVAFTNATAFSPTDTVPFSRWSKLAMMLQSAISLATGALVIARAVNILK